MGHVDFFYFPQLTSMTLAPVFHPCWEDAEGVPRLASFLKGGLFMRLWRGDRLPPPFSGESCGPSSSSCCSFLSSPTRSWRHCPTSILVLTGWYPSIRASSQIVAHNSGFSGD